MAITSSIDHDLPAGGDLIRIVNPWIRETHPGANVNAGYLTLVNLGREAVMLLKVESDAFESIEVHEMAAIGGLMGMRKVDNLVVPANGEVQFKPGGKHLMLTGPRAPLVKGHEVKVTLTFESGRQKTVSVKVASR